MRKIFCLLLLICIVALVKITDGLSPPAKKSVIAVKMTPVVFQSQTKIIEIDNTYFATETKPSNLHDGMMKVTNSDKQNEQVQISAIQIPPQTKEGLSIKKDLSNLLFKASQFSGSKNPNPTMEGLATIEKVSCFNAFVERT